ncbi:hypothetical protein DAI22_03g369700 [Oryza sativa Japonica Group]|nr:hypothetical protein DAI22_03g369700 [Oryza sativa Japonica Group]
MGWSSTTARGRTRSPPWTPSPSSSTSSSSTAPAFTSASSPPKRPVKPPPLLASSVHCAMREAINQGGQEGVRRRRRLGDDFPDGRAGDDAGRQGALRPRRRREVSRELYCQSLEIDDDGSLASLATLRENS